MRGGSLNISEAPEMSGSRGESTLHPLLSGSPRPTVVPIMIDTDSPTANTHAKTVQ
jgi:hypothetical protein